MIQLPLAWNTVASSFSLQDQSGIHGPESKIPVAPCRGNTSIRNQNILPFKL